MKVSQLLLGSLVAACLACIATAPAGAAPRGACSVLTLTEVRAIVGGPVVIFDPNSSGPITRGGHTTSTCRYMLGRFGARGASLFLLWGSHADVTQSQQYYAKRDKEPSSIKGGVFVVASVASNGTLDLPASKKLLAAALAKL